MRNARDAAASTTASSSTAGSPAGAAAVNPTVSGCAGGSAAGAAECQPQRTACRARSLTVPAKRTCAQTCAAAAALPGCAPVASLAWYSCPAIVLAPCRCRGDCTIARVKTTQLEPRRDLTLTHATSLVVGITIGTGVFLKSAAMAQAVGTPALVLGAWVVAGIVALIGALCFSELGAMLPDAGGEYVYLRAAFGEVPGFLYACNSFLLGGASIAAYGAAVAIFISDIHVFGHRVVRAHLQPVRHLVHLAVRHAAAARDRRHRGVRRDQLRRCDAGRARADDPHRRQGGRHRRRHRRGLPVLRHARCGQPRRRAARGHRRLFRVRRGAVRRRVGLQRLAVPADGRQRGARARSATCHAPSSAARCWCW